MQRAATVLNANEFDPARVVDRVVLDADDRHRRRIVLTGEGGTRVLLDLAHATMLRDGDGLLLEDGAIVRVAAKPETLVEIAAADEAARLRLAWHIGNRHTEVQVVGERLRIRRDHVLEAMLRGLGAELTVIEVPFEPERGAYDTGHHHPGDRHYAHDHRQDDHDHGHGHGQHHDENDHGG